MQIRVFGILFSNFHAIFLFSFWKYTWVTDGATMGRHGLGLVLNTSQCIELFLSNSCIAKHDRSVKEIETYSLSHRFYCDVGPAQQCRFLATTPLAISPRKCDHTPLLRCVVGQRMGRTGRTISTAILSRRPHLLQLEMHGHGGCVTASLAMKPRIRRARLFLPLPLLSPSQSDTSQPSLP